eukprot:1610414-Prymnesium_polylepis.1
MRSTPLGVRCVNSRPQTRLAPKKGVRVRRHRTWRTWRTVGRLPHRVGIMSRDFAEVLRARRHAPFR